MAQWVVGGCWLAAILAVPFVLALIDYRRRENLP